MCLLLGFNHVNPLYIWLNNCRPKSRGVGSCSCIYEEIKLGSYSRSNSWRILGGEHWQKKIWQHPPDTTPSDRENSEGMGQENPKNSLQVNTSADIQNLTFPQAIRKLRQKLPLQIISGKLSYLYKCCRLDIAYATDQCASFSMNPKRQYVKSLCHLGSYLKGTLTREQTISPRWIKHLRYMWILIL